MAVIAKKAKKKAAHERLTLSQLCDRVTSMAVPFEDVAEFLENSTYELCVDGKCKSAIQQLSRVTSFFETMENKNEENCRDLADTYILIGEVNQYVGAFKESIEWFKKAAVVFDRYAMPFHNLATSYLELGDTKNAVKSLEQEIALEPGNYFSCLRLADLYEQPGKPPCPQSGQYPGASQTHNALRKSAARRGYKTAAAAACGNRQELQRN
jgi:tetratricopeptide (TPR) repeat protein